MFKKILTNPQNHHPKDFIYLVHGINIWQMEGTLEDSIDKIQNPNRFFDASLISHLNEKSAKKRLSWDKGGILQLGTSGNIGLIIEPYEDSLIRFTSYLEAGTPSSDEEIKSFLKREKTRIKSPIDIFTGTTLPNEYNRLILEGNPKTKIQGIFYRSDSGKKQELQEKVSMLQRLLKKEVPIVRFPIPKSLLERTTFHLSNIFSNDSYYTDYVKGFKPGFKF